MSVLQDADLKPYLKLWLLLTTNSQFIADLKIPKNKTDVANKLGLDPEIVDRFVAVVPAHPSSFSDIQGTFGPLLQSVGYTNVACPHTMDPITGM